MTIVFNEEAADSLITTARAADTELRNEGVLRRGAVETAVQDFSGGYARLFTTASSFESEDRGKLAGILDDLANQVEEAQRKAAEETDRHKKLADWRVRDEEREQRRPHRHDRCGDRQLLRPQTLRNARCPTHHLGNVLRAATHTDLGRLLE
ncbi:hypothetical protein GCM10022198_25680 [Klugiella xanthotipulae]|uniref:Excreted virulence factor EspC (Type VII ESX diderm) n=1 Tax=Klugiella xanthotipulae TaxID=244735 RepID=A0A543I5P5_9MICO|nr:hypothetical protein [Klugiella xanthotipulae]TQM65898.1 hypothetical protein FB466_0718 [Klugiella xanthotipulae]